ncbi:MAG: TRAP transporter small permease [Desulfofustis sp.]|nr:TRAP transporter small permease [Desulfofustis sp.]NNK12766.1 TRAP transporter small permease [Desulfofustis sp.]NNK56577.1 TRAP transporter small permease [Desulfofustis sp.]
MIDVIKRWLARVLEFISITLLVSMAVIVVMAVIFRFLGNSLVWYDEVASVNLAWLTYYGSALAVIHRGHLGFPGLFLSLPKNLRAVAFITAELVVISFFAVIGYAGWYLLEIFGDETLVSLSFVPLSFTQSVIPVGAALIILAEVLSIPDAWRKSMAGVDYEKEMIDQAIEEASKS